MKNTWPSEDIASEAWGPAYETTMCSTVVDLSQKTMREIHRIILVSRSLHGAAGTLGVGDLTLKMHLAKTTYTTESGEIKPLSYDVMKNTWPSEDIASEACGPVYEQAINNKTSKKRKYSSSFFSSNETDTNEISTRAIPSSQRITISNDNELTLYLMDLLEDDLSLCNTLN